MSFQDITMHLAMYMMLATALEKLEGSGELVSVFEGVLLNLYVANPIGWVLPSALIPRRAGQLSCVAV